LIVLTGHDCLHALRVHHTVRQQPLHLPAHLMVPDGAGHGDRASIAYSRPTAQLLEASLAE
jgi:hypothetical protein